MVEKDDTAEDAMNDQSANIPETELKTEKTNENRAHSEKHGERHNVTIELVDECGGKGCDFPW